MSPDEGEIFVNGQKANIKNPNDATKLGIGMVHQHFMLIDCFTGLENIILGAEPVDKLGVSILKKLGSKSKNSASITISASIWT
jgi:simple sugar transport system ATP-binding protein